MSSKKYYRHKNHQARGMNCRDILYSIVDTHNMENDETLLAKYVLLVLLVLLFPMAFVILWIYETENA